MASYTGEVWFRDAVCSESVTTQADSWSTACARVVDTAVRRLGESRRAHIVRVDVRKLREPVTLTADEALEVADLMEPRKHNTNRSFGLWRKLRGDNE